MTWRRICRDPLMWRTIDMRNDGFLRHYNFDLDKMCRHVIDRSSGGLVDINVEHFGTDNLLKYITNNSSGIRRLRLVCCYDITNEGLIEAVSKLPLLEHLEISFSFASARALHAIGRACPLLKSLKLNRYSHIHARRDNADGDDDAGAIASPMHGLRHLQLCGNNGLQRILDGCPDLESLDLRMCFNIQFGVVLKRKCSGEVKSLNREEVYAHSEFDPDYGDFLLFGRSVYRRRWWSSIELWNIVCNNFCYKL